MARRSRAVRERTSRPCLGPFAIGSVCECPVASVDRTIRWRIVNPVAGPLEYFDEVVFASHADQTLGDADTTQPLQNGRFWVRFPTNPTMRCCTPILACSRKRRRAWASWNYHIPAGEVEPSASVTYDLSRLQNHQTVPRRFC